MLERIKPFAQRLFKISMTACLIAGAQSLAQAAPAKPILISESNSTRAIALESITLTPEPFSPTASSLLYGLDTRTRITFFVLNLPVQSEQDLAIIMADAEDASHQHYPCKVESVRPAPGQPWMSQIVLRLNENIGDVGDVLIGISYGGVSSNRVRVSIGHRGGGPPDDPGAGPTPVTFTISGQVIDETNKALSGIPVVLSGYQEANTITDANGNYSFSNLAGGGNFQITPSNNPLYAFTSQGTNTLTGNLSLSFTAARRKYTLSGFITDGHIGLNGVSVTLTGGNNPSPLTTITTDGGIFSFSGLTAGYDYAVTPTSPFFFAFGSQEFKNLLGDASTTFTGTLRSYTVSGRFTDENNNPLGGSIVGIYSGNGIIGASTSADAGGWYSFTNIPASYNYELVPSTTATHSFNRQFALHLGVDQTINFAGTRRHYTISGKITDRSQQGVAGVNVTLSGQLSEALLTDASGSFSFNDLPAGFDYNVTIAKTDYICDPAARNYYLLQDTVSDFTAIRTYRLRGRVTDDNGKGLIGITMNVSGSETGKTITASDGSYLLTVTTAGDYQLTPSEEQNFFTFTPAAKTFTALSDHQTANFTGILSTDTHPSYVLEFDGSPMTVDYGDFWQVQVPLGHFLWEFWAMPGEGAHARYLLSDGYGGAHSLLFGFYNDGLGRYRLFGNIWNGANATFFYSDDGPAVGEWGHYAVGWDGKNIVTYYDGVPIGRQAFAGPRLCMGRNWGAGMPLIGGSDHQNLIGRIAEVRGYEDSDPLENSPESSFAPQTLFSADGKLLSYFFRPSQVVADVSSGYLGVSHPGRLRGFKEGYTVDCPDCPTPRFVRDPAAPDFSNPGNPGSISAPFSGAPPTPADAIIFDSFSRNNSTYILSGKGGLGATETGSASTQTWQTGIGSSQLQPFGVLNGRGVVLANEKALAWISPGAFAASLDIRVDRGRDLYGNGANTGLSFRVVDKDNFYFAYTSDDTLDSSAPKKLSVGYYQGGVRINLASNIALPSNTWTTLRVVTLESGEIDIYANNDLVYSSSSNVFATASGAGLYNNAPGLGLTNRWDNFTLYAAP